MSNRLVDDTRDLVIARDDVSLRVGYSQALIPQKATRAKEDSSRQTSSFEVSNLRRY